MAAPIGTRMLDVIARVAPRIARTAAGCSLYGHSAIVGGRCSWCRLPVATDATTALRAEFDHGKAVCRNCFVIVDAAAAREWGEGRPLCPTCYALHVEEGF